jgi:hypothetical protein
MRKAEIIVFAIALATTVLVMITLATGPTYASQDDVQPIGFFQLIGETISHWLYVATDYLFGPLMPEG